MGEGKAEANRGGGEDNSDMGSNPSRKNKKSSWDIEEDWMRDWEAKIRQKERLRKQGRLRTKAPSQQSQVTLSMDDIEASARAAAKARNFYGTPFLDAETTAKVAAKFGKRARFSCTKLPDETATRARFVFTNPVLKVEATAFFEILLVENVDLVSVTNW